MMMMVVMVVLMMMAMVNFMEQMFQKRNVYNVEDDDEHVIITLSEDRWLTLHSQRGFQDR